MEMNKNEETTKKSMICSRSGNKREVHNIQALINKQGKSQVLSLTLHLKELEKEEKNPKNQQKEQNNKS